MAIIKRERKNGTRYQVKVKSSDGGWLTKTFGTQREAQKYEAGLQIQKLNGAYLSSEGSQTVDEYFERWFAECQINVTEGWRITQRQICRDYISPLLGSTRMQSVTASMIGMVLRKVIELGRGSQTQLHVYNVLRKMFGDAVEVYGILGSNPVRKQLKPRLPEKERRYLTPSQARILLQSVSGSQFETAVWLGLVAGLRVGEIQALRWENVDLIEGDIHIRATYVRKERKFRDYPKGRKWHSIPIPPELHSHLLEARKRASGDYVVSSPRREFMNYCAFNKALKRYCREAGLPEISTHELRHSTAGIWKSHGKASDDDMRYLFAHSSSRVTGKYIHAGNEHLRNVAKIIQMFPEVDLNAPVSPKFPHRAIEAVDGARHGC